MCIINFGVHKINIHYRLNAQFQENSEESVKFSVIHSMIIERFPITTMSLSRLIREIFPNASIKRLGKKRVSHVIGIQPRQPSLELATDTAIYSTPSFLPTIISPTIASSSSKLMMDLLLELQMEREKRVALEMEVAMLKERLQAESKAAV